MDFFILLTIEVKLLLFRPKQKTLPDMKNLIYWWICSIVPALKPAKFLKLQIAARKEQKLLKFKIASPFNVLRCKMYGYLGKFAKINFLLSKLFLIKKSV
jgi:hypothetical protein